MVIEAKNVVLPFSSQHLKAICRVPAETDAGLIWSDHDFSRTLQAR
jgi:hypothetical protein